MCGQGGPRCTKVTRVKSAKSKVPVSLRLGHYPLSLDSGSGCRKRWAPAKWAAAMPSNTSHHSPASAFSPSRRSDAPILCVRGSASFGPSLRPLGWLSRLCVALDVCACVSAREAHGPSLRRPVQFGHILRTFAPILPWERESMPGREVEERGSSERQAKLCWRLASETYSSWMEQITARLASPRISAPPLCPRLRLLPVCLLLVPACLLTDGPIQCEPSSLSDNQRASDPAHLSLPTTIRVTPLPASTRKAKSIPLLDLISGAPLSSLDKTSRSRLFRLQTQQTPPTTLLRYTIVPSPTCPIS